MTRRETRRPVQVPGFKLEEMDDEVILFHPTRSTVVHTNQSGALIWQLCDGRRSVEEIIALLRQTYPDSAAAIAGDVERVLSDLTDSGVIQWP